MGIPRRLLLATHNRGKIEEVEQLLGPQGVEIVSARDLGLPEPEETERSFEGNARVKAHAAARATGLPALADDSGLEVAALGGAPGVDTAGWAETPQGRDFVMAMEKVHRLLEERGAPRPRRARFVCVLCLAQPDGGDMLFRGEVEGQLVWPMRGRLGHGFDPVFQPDGHDLTFAEMAPEDKNRISHRARALAAFMRAMQG
ncbi:MAG: RdgB/HAM1 family non-canonical purine NTP pyrophosphatase [Alphaproteobacteria bacterium]|nr:MAG: RdgB/HAM1 family non-canonical purine NTP pyrophosphatase [Alphaproteobacteria bacterium]